MRQKKAPVLKRRLRHFIPFSDEISAYAKMARRETRSA